MHDEITIAELQAQMARRTKRHNDEMEAKNKEIAELKLQIKARDGTIQELQARIDGRPRAIIGA